MAESMVSRIRNAWNVFVGRPDEELPPSPQMNYGNYSIGGSSHRVIVRQPTDRSIITSICTKIAVDAASFDFRHIKVGENGRYEDDMRSSLADCLEFSANVDQTGRELILDCVFTMLTGGHVAIVPVETTSSPVNSNAYDILQLRAGEVVQWFSDRVKVRVYDEFDGTRKEVTLLKKYVAIVENPFYSIMNEPNSTLQRLTRKLSLLDNMDEANSSGKLDVLIQLPYTIRSESREKQAERRLKSIEFQLKASQYGVAYIDSTEKVTQLNRPVENNLLPQITYLMEKLYNELGLTKAIMDGTADEAAMNQYFDRVITPISVAIREKMTVKFLSKTARTQGQRISATRDPFRFIAPSQLADIADKLTRNEIASSNDIRVILQWKPSKDPKADELRNSNMPAPAETPAVPKNQAEQLQERPERLALAKGVLKDSRDQIGQKLLELEARRPTNL